ncbi:MAG: DUF348 domain-containing protein, partial [Anaerolineales bacterium]|nr:DUF348 domain-containing protein [Anaerolineales bacterium]
QEHTTFALTVDGFLDEQGIFLQESDRVNPSPGTMLWGEETIFLTISKGIQVYADGQTILLNTAERRPENIILEAGLLLFPQDRLLVDGLSVGENSLMSPAESHSIQVLRGTAIELQTEDGTFHFTTDTDILADALWKENIELFEADHLSVPLNTTLDGTPLRVELIRSKPLLVQLPEQSVTIRTTANSVGAALAQSGLSLQGLDYSNPPEDEPLPDNRQIEVIRVKEEILLHQEQIQFSTDYLPVSDQDLDQLQIVSGGEFGIEAQRLRIIYENGSEVSREVEKEWTVKEPKPRVIGYGTDINILTVNTQDGQISYWRKITAWATSYDSTCPGCDTITASGTVLKKGTIAVRLHWYRKMKGTKVYIPGYGFGTIEDVGGGVSWSTNWVDLGYKKENYEPWSQNVTVYFLTPIPPPENIMYVLY